MKRYRSCFVVLLGCILLVLLVVFGGRAYGHLRMALVNHELFALAEQLGYTPDALLRHRVKMRDFNLFFPWDAYCDAHLYFTTPLEPVSFAQKLHLARPELTGPGKHHYYDQLYSYFPIAVSDADAQQVQEDFRRGYMNSYDWWLSGENQGNVTLFETSNMSVTLQYNGRDIQDNIVEIYRSGGAFPIWMNCPIKTTESGTSGD